MTRCEYCGYDSEMDVLNQIKVVCACGHEICQRCGCCITHGKSCEHVGSAGFKMTVEKLEQFKKEMGIVG